MVRALHMSLCMLKTVQAVCASLVRTICILCSVVRVRMPFDGFAVMVNGLQGLLWVAARSLEALLSDVNEMLCTA